MRRTHYLTITCVLLLAGTVLWSGCGTAQRDCFDGLGACADLITSGSGGSPSSSSMTTASGTMASSSTGMDPTCEGVIVEGLSEADTKRLISDKCGVFVRADAAGPTEDGTQAAPFRSLQKAIDEATNSKRVYACAKAPYAEALTIAVAVTMYGGFECDQGWVWKAATRSLITGAAQKVSLTLDNMAGGARIEGFKITSASLTGQTGESSIAVAVDAIAAELVACDVEAGDGADGVEGLPPAGPALKGTDAPVLIAAATSACINPASLKSGVPGSTTCDDGTSGGGAGAKGGITGTNNGDGATGANGTPAGASTGKGGAGQDGTNACVAGSAGKDGIAGVAGGAGTSPGTLSLTGLTSTPGADGTDGTAGSKGQGGGGGGGAKSGVFCQGSVDGNGASGGGGGAGGCGGKGGGAGKAGGSSIAVISLGTKLVLTNVTLKGGKGGNGGKGTAGQGGGLVGLGANGGASSGFLGSKPGCKGGDGGLGGDGGPGGGGRGGHSLGLAVLGTPLVSALPFTPGTPGDGGFAGMGGSPTGDGSKGLGGTKDAACWDFAKKSTCAQ